MVIVLKRVVAFGSLSQKFFNSLVRLRQILIQLSLELFLPVNVSPFCQLLQMRLFPGLVELVEVAPRRPLTTRPRRAYAEVAPRRPQYPHGLARRACISSSLSASETSDYV